jgi:hypothetical protein
MAKKIGIERSQKNPIELGKKRTRNGGTGGFRIFYSSRKMSDKVLNFI